jgi:thiamine biosynthesis lipoprotein
LTEGRERPFQDPRGGRGATAVTLNGIAQGFTADRAAAALAPHGVTDALIDTRKIGGLGSDGAAGAWKVGIQHPRVDDAYISVAGLSGRFLATSGDFATTFSDDYAKNHLIDPRSGTSPPVFASVSVAARSAMGPDGPTRPISSPATPAGWPATSRRR